MKIIALPYVVCILAPDVIRKESFVKVCFVGHGTLKSAGLWCEIFWGAPRWVLTKSDHFTAASDSKVWSPSAFYILFLSTFCSLLYLSVGIRLGLICFILLRVSSVSVLFHSK